MPSLRILVADDQIPDEGLSEQDFRKKFFAKHEGSSHNQAFIDQCIFMRRIVQALRDAGYQVAAARTYSDAEKKIRERKFDLAIIDLGWFMDSSLPEEARPAAGWSLCDKIDEQDARNGKRTPQILFSSRFPAEPELSREAARRQKLPIFKEATDTVRNSLLAAVGFVDATLATQRSLPNSTSSYDEQIKNLALELLQEPLRDYRRWTSLSLVFVALSIVSLLAGVPLAYLGRVQVATLSSISSVVAGAISVLLYSRIKSAQNSVSLAQREVLKRLENQSKETRKTT